MKVTALDCRVVVQSMYYSEPNIQYTQGEIRVASLE